MIIMIIVYMLMLSKNTPGARPIRSNIANRYVRPKTLISVEAKKLLIKNLFNYLNDIQHIFTTMIGFVTWPPLLI